MSRLDEYGPKGPIPFIVYCIFEPAGEQKWTMKKTRPNAKINNGKAFLCKDASGQTGIMGMMIWATDEEDAKKKLEIVRQNYLKADREPMTWH